MEKNDGLLLAIWILVILGVIMIILGGFVAPQILWPPIITGIGFFVIALGFNQLRK